MLHINRAALANGFLNNHSCMASGFRESSTISNAVGQAIRLAVKVVAISTASTVEKYVASLIDGVVVPARYTGLAISNHRTQGTNICTSRRKRVFQGTSSKSKTNRIDNSSTVSTKFLLAFLFSVCLCFF